MTPLRFALTALAVLVVLIGLVVLIRWIGDPLGLGKRKLDKAENTAAVATGQAVVADAKALTAADVATIVEAARQRDGATIVIRENNRDAILTAPGADARLDPALVQRINRGLCRYDANAADPRCAALRGSDTAELPEAG